MDISKLESINQTQAHEGTSSRYSFIPTTHVLSILGDHGWLPAKASEAWTRSEGNRGFQKHIVRLRNTQFTKELQVGEELPEIVVLNSHMGSSSFQLMLGIFRLVCANGLTVGNTWNEYRIKHVGFTARTVEAAILEIVQRTPLVMGAIERFKQIELQPEERAAFAQSAIELKFDGDKYAVDPREVLKPWRYDDGKSNDLWRTYNTIQENIVKGGVRQRREDGTRIRSRAIKSIDEDIRVNRALWTLTEKMAELKLAA